MIDDDRSNRLIDWLVDWLIDGSVINFDGLPTEDLQARVITLQPSVRHHVVVIRPSKEQLHRVCTTTDKRQSLITDFIPGAAFWRTQPNTVVVWRQTGTIRLPGTSKHTVLRDSAHWSYGTHTHTHTQPFYCSSGICPGLPGWAGTRKVKPARIKSIWIYWSKR